MALQEKIQNLKDGPKEDKVAVASGIAVSVVVVLLAGWTIYFFHRIQSGSQQIQLGGGAQDQFNFDSVQAAQQTLQQQFDATKQELYDIRTQSMQGGDVQMQSQQMQIEGDVSNGQFGASSSQ